MQNEKAAKTVENKENSSKAIMGEKKKAKQKTKKQRAFVEKMLKVAK
jgi:hypothetical protein